MSAKRANRSEVIRVELRMSGNGGRWRDRPAWPIVAGLDCLSLSRFKVSRFNAVAHDLSSAAC